MSSEKKTTMRLQKNQHQITGLGIILLLGILLAGMYFRFVGLDWDDNQHVHPDERFLTMVASSVQSVDGFAEYFNTETSTLNPHNVGYGYYVYGTLPLFMVRYSAELIHQTGYGDIYLVGRFLSAALDSMTILLAFLIAWRLYKNQRLALISAAFTAFAVLQIQLSHFFTVDTYANFFTYLAFYCAALVYERSKTSGENTSENIFDFRSFWLQFGPYAAFGAALGLAVASKVSTAAIAISLPLAAYLGWTKINGWKDRSRQIGNIFISLVLAAAIALLVFRVFQPYAFTGPEFLDVKINPKWWANLTELRNQSTGDVDFPPALQWARRPVWFGWKNMTIWGLGLPLGILSWVGFLWMAFRIIRGEARQHVLIWVWTAVFFLWQGTGFVSSMRYLLPIYPTMAIIAAWALVSLGKWMEKENIEQAQTPPPDPVNDEIEELLPVIEKDAEIPVEQNRLPPSRGDNIRRLLAILTTIIVIIGTFLWAFAFSRIYTRTESRTAASEWVFANVPGAINIYVEQENGTSTNLPLAMTAGMSIQSGNPVLLSFSPQVSGDLIDVTLTGVYETNPALDAQNQRLPRTFVVTLLDASGQSLNFGVLTESLMNDQPRKIMLETPSRVEAGALYFLKYEVVDQDTEIVVIGENKVSIQAADRLQIQAMPDPIQTIKPDQDFLISSFRFQNSGTVNQIYLNRVVDWENQPGSKTLEVSLLAPGGVEPLARGYVISEFKPGNDPRGEGYWVSLDKPVIVDPEQIYALQMKLVAGSGAIAIYSSKPAIETTWDMTVPFDLGLGNPFDTYNGIYRTNLNLELYWDDNVSKRELILTTLDQADYIFSSTNRVWGTVPRVPERYPVSTEFYRLLLGCPLDKDIVWCYNTAEVGDYTGQLGFDLVNVTTSYPNLGSIEFNTQFAEEAFSVYDHPKVMIFKKNENYNSETVRALLEAVDVSKAIHLTPRQASKYKGLLTLPAYRWLQQQAGGTWSELFNGNALYNQYPGLALVVWYLVITLLGWVVYPFIRLAMHGARDRGYPFVKIGAMLIIAWITWLLGSAGIPVTRGLITMVIVGIFLVNGFFFLIQRKAILAEIKQNWKYYLGVEAVFLAFFLMFVLIRLGNPDLWHPAKGGEKPMDFSYFNAVLKSSTYPPYDPWYAGGYINYYYYGFVIVGVLVKWIGITPSIAYNLIVPTLFGFTALGAFSVVWNLTTHSHFANRTDAPETSEHGLEHQTRIVTRSPWYASLAGAGFVALAGNLGTLRMIWQGFQRLSLPAGFASVEEGSLIQRMGWGLSGFWKYIQGASLPYGWGDWYWNPSRVYPGSPITEFPFFTFLYADLHAHMISLPITIFALGWVVSIIQGQWKWDGVPSMKWLGFLSSLTLGGIVIGALRPTNTWDLPAYLILAIVAIVYSAYRYADWPGKMIAHFAHFSREVIAAVSAGILILFIFAFYQPFATWYAQGYGSLALWKEAEQAPTKLYLVHWGLFLFLVISWLWLETIDWMAKTPVSALNKLRPYRTSILFAGFAIILLIVILMVIAEVQISWLVLPPAVWAGILILRSGQPDNKRLTLFLVGTALIITLFVEVFVLVGDIGRMNTVFKFYMQAWTMLGISAAVSLYWLIPAIQNHKVAVWRNVWLALCAFLIGSVLLFPVLAGADKIRDRMSIIAPHTLDGMAFMQSSRYNENGLDMDLSEDYRAIRWMQENVQGSPVIVEGKTGEYHWGTRFTIYTGLPGVVGWNWHQIQQRTMLPGEWVTNRILEIQNFYTTIDVDQAKAFLRKYQVKYIVVGQLEAAMYPGEGLNKFTLYNGQVWSVVYQDGNTTIYEVIGE